MLNVTEKFFKIAKENPNKKALVFGYKIITYGELAERSNSLAKLISNKNKIVGVYLSRSDNFIVAILAILKSGSAYLPLDMSLSSKRLNYMLSDSGVSAIITERSVNLDNFSTNKNKLLYIEDAKVSKSENIEILKGEIAYVIYTSGSTGSPKGIKMGHNSLINLIEWQNTTSKFSKGITLQYASISFDVSFQEIFSTLSFGGTLVLCKEEIRLNPEILLDFIILNKIERIFLPFVALQQLALISQNKQMPTTLGEIITAGEQLRITPAIKFFFKRLQKCKLINQYGPTETHVVTAYELTGNPEKWPMLPPIGKAIKNIQTYILDENQSYVVKGEVGELYIGGKCLLKGYINNTSIAKKPFFYSKKLNIKLYKTGDFVRMSDSGNIEFIGRKDNQIKVRGYRIELGEIEGALSKHPFVKECFVQAKKDYLGENRLIAYIVVKKNNDKHLKKEFPSNMEFISFLKNELPEYLIPSAYLQIPSLPITSSGKVDRNQLPKLSINRPKLMSSYILPRNDNEKRIAKIWEEVLQMNDIGVNDNFFEVGGNSLLIASVYQKLIQIYSEKIHIVDLFEFPTIRLLAKKIESKQNVLDKSKYNRKISNAKVADRRAKIRKFYGR